MDKATVADIIRKGLSSVDVANMECGTSQDTDILPILVTDDEALALFTDLKLTKSKYKLLCATGAQTRFFATVNSSAM